MTPINIERIFATCLAVVVLTPVLSAQAATAVPVLDQNHLTGTWYEIERYPTKREKHCVADVVELIAVGEKTHQLQLVNACTTGKGYTNTTNRSARAKDTSGALKVGTFPFTSKLWVLSLGPDLGGVAGYQWALIGNPNHKEAWIFSRTPTLPTETVAAIKTQAAAQGFASDTFITPARNPLQKRN